MGPIPFHLLQMLCSVSLKKMPCPKIYSYLMFVSPHDIKHPFFPYRAIKLTVEERHKRKAFHNQQIENDTLRISTSVFAVMGQGDITTCKQTHMFYGKQRVQRDILDHNTFFVH